jgi:hypothetical protein
MYCGRSAEFKAAAAILMRRHGIRVIHSSSRHPETQGLVEQANGQVKRLIRTWKDALPIRASRSQRFPFSLITRSQSLPAANPTHYASTGVRTLRMLFGYLSIAANRYALRLRAKTLNRHQVTCEKKAFANLLSIIVHLLAKQLQALCLKHAHRASLTPAPFKSLSYHQFLYPNRHLRAHLSRHLPLHHRKLLLHHRLSNRRIIIMTSALFAVLVPSPDLTIQVGP